MPQMGLIKSLKVALNHDLLPHMDFTNVVFPVNLMEPENVQREAINIAPSRTNSHLSNGRDWKQYSAL